MTRTGNGARSLDGPWVDRRAAGHRLNGMTEPGSIEGVTANPDALLAACRQRAAEARREVAQVAAALSGPSHGILTDRQRAQIGNMLRRLVGEIDSALCNGFVAALERRDDLRRDAVADFGASAPGGAYERLAAGGTILDSSLIEAALHRVLEHALEGELRPSVVDAWQTDSDAGTLRVPLAGRWSDRLLGEPLRDYMVDRAGRTDGYGEPVIRFEDLEPALVTRLHWRLAALLRARAAVALDYGPAGFDAEIQRAVRAALDANAERARGPSAAVRAAEALARESTFDGTLMIDILRRAEVPLFFAVFARMTGLRPTLVRRLVFEPDGLGLAIAARAVGMSADQLVAVYRMTRHARAPARVSASDDAGRLARVFNRIAAEDAARVCDYWRLPQDYLEAVWRVGQTSAGERAADRI